MTVNRIPDFMLQQVVSIAAYTGEGAYGPTFDDAVDFRCRIEPKRSLIKKLDGTEVTTSARGFFFPEAVIPVESIVTWAGREYQVIESMPVPGPSGSTHHIEIMLGSR